MGKSSARKSSAKSEILAEHGLSRSWSLVETIRRYDKAAPTPSVIDKLRTADRRDSSRAKPPKFSKALHKSAARKNGGGTGRSFRCLVLAGRRFSEISPRKLSIWPWLFHVQLLGVGGPRVFGQLGDEIGRERRISRRIYCALLVNTDHHFSPRSD